MISDQEIEYYKSIIDDLHVVFDVGCQHDNVFDELKPGINLHLFDPVKSLHLEQKISGKENVRFNNFALGNYSGESIFHAGYGSILRRDELGPDDDHSESTVDIDTLENYCAGQAIVTIDLLKIDTEGFDFEVIKGCRTLLPVIKRIQFEHWNNQMVVEIMQYLSGRRFTMIKSKPINFIAEL